jgi:hypothetical protein
MTFFFPQYSFLFILWHYCGGAYNINKPDKFFSGKGKDTRVGRYLNKNKYAFLTIYYAIISVIFIYGDQSKWVILPFFVAIPIGIILTHQNFFIDNIKHPDLRIFIMVLLVCLPILSFGLAKYNGLNVKENISYKMISKIESNSKANFDSLVGFKYLGTAGNKIFISKLDNSEIILLNDNSIDYIGLLSKD